MERRHLRRERDCVAMAQFTLADIENRIGR
jgi:hypothetical protein